MAVEFASNILLRNADLSDNFTSDTFQLEKKDGFSIHVAHTGDAIGSFYLIVSIDNLNWFILPDSERAIDEAGEIFYNVNDCSYAYVRLGWAHTSGTGLCNSKFHTRGVK